MRSIDTIIEDWKVEFGTMAYGKNGAFYRRIDWKIEKNLLMNLVQTMIDEGYGREALVTEQGFPNAIVQMKVVNGIAAPDGASSRKKSAILKSKKITASNWNDALKEFFRGQTSTFTPENRLIDIPEQEAYKPKPEKPIEIDPKDRIKLDTSGIEDPELDLDFLKEMGIEESFVTGNNNE